MNGKTIREPELTPEQRQNRMHPCSIAPIYYSGQSLTREQISEVYSGLLRQHAFQPIKDAWVRHLLGLFKARLEAIIDADEPMRLRTAHLRVDIAALLLNSQYNGALTPDPDAFYEGRTEDEQDDALEVADAVLELILKAAKR